MKADNNPPPRNRYTLSMASPNCVTDYIAGNTIIRHTEIDPALLDVAAIVEEQDTNLLLGRSPVIMETVESLPALLLRMEKQMVETPGSVIVKHASPKRFLAIIYDIDSSPICQESWIEQALTTIIEHCEKSRFETLAMPLLGTSYGPLQQDTAIHILQNLLIRLRPKYPKHILIYHLD